jgi:uncharacterized LabA/DUF88 family protein
MGSLDSYEIRIGFQANMGLFGLFEINAPAFDFTFELPDTGDLIPEINLGGLLDFDFDISASAPEWLMGAVDFLRDIDLNISAAGITGSIEIPNLTIELADFIYFQGDFKLTLGDTFTADAYTGIDPENEIQKAFQQFLRDAGYKVIAKEIRRFSDGGMKANLDIELVVDLIRLAPRLDAAVIVSGDGDFAPAIRAVQEMGVRVEVAGFRRNTSLDLLEVADEYRDLATLNARPGRPERVVGVRAPRTRRSPVASTGDRVAAAAPAKEGQGAPRRRRSSGGTPSARPQTRRRSSGARAER